VLLPHPAAVAVLLLLLFPIVAAAAAIAAAAADASRMNALTGSPVTGEGSKAYGSGMLKQQGYILLVPQGTGDVTQGQVRMRNEIRLLGTETPVAPGHNTSMTWSGIRDLSMQQRY
jgi:hypothetical protein